MGEHYCVSMSNTSSKARSHPTLKVLPHPLTWLSLAIVVLCLDWFTDPLISFPFGFIFPVVLAAYHRGFAWGAIFAVGLPLARFGSNLLKDVPWSLSVSTINLGIRLAMLCGLAWLVAHSVAQRGHIQALRCLLPICAWCGRIRDNQNSWQRLETYLSADGGISITHTICPECEAKHFGRSP